jgi:transcriptional regulator with XRE-family HTH domain
MGRPHRSAHISLLEQGGTVPTDRALRTIADRLGISPVEFLRDRG